MDREIMIVRSTERTASRRNIEKERKRKRD